MAIGAAKILLAGGRRGSLVSPTTAELVFEAADPAIQGGSYYNLPTAELALTAPDPFLNTPFSFTPTTGQLTLTAPNPTPHFSTLAPPTLALVFTAPNPILNVDVPVWSNGFAAYREIVIRAGRVSEALDGLKMLFDETLQGLRTTGNGGRVQSASGWDIRFTEDDGTTVLDHELALYTAATGATKAWLEADVGTSQTVLRIYYGKSVAATEEDPSGVWLSSYHQVLDCRTGLDRSGNARHLTPSNIGSGTIIGDAGSYGGNSVATLANVSFLSGITEGTLQALISPDQTMLGSSGGWLCVNTPTTASDTAAMGMSYFDDSTPGANTIFGKVKTASGNHYAISSPGLHAAETQAIHFTWRTGEPAAIYLNGEDVTATATTQTGGLTLGTGGMFLGVGTRNGSWVGLVDELRIGKFKHGASRIAAEALSYLTPRKFYGIGGENLFGDATLAPVLPPYFTSGAVDEAQTIDVAALGYHPAGSSLTLESVSANTGTATINNGDLLYTPSEAGEGTITCVIEEPGGKQATGYVYVTAAAPSGGSPIELPEVNPARQVFVNNRATLLDALNGVSALGPLVPGDTVWLQNGTYTGNFTIARNGTAPTAQNSLGNPIVLRSVNVGSPIFTGVVTQNGNYTVLHGAYFQGQAAHHNFFGTGQVALRCTYDNTSALGDTTNVVNSTDTSFLFCEWKNLRGWGARCGNDPNGGKSLRATFYRCYWHDTVDSAANNGRESLQLGRTDGPNNIQSNYSQQTLAYECYFLRCQQNDNDNEVISVKSSDNVVKRCVMENGRFFTIRHGFRNQIISCRTTNSNGISVFGSDHVIGGNATNQILMRAGHHYQEGGPTADGNRASARDCLVCSNTATLYVGSQSAQAAVVDALDNAIENHSGQIRVENALAGFTGEVLDPAMREAGTTYAASASQTFPDLFQPIVGVNSGPASPWIAPPRGYGSYVGAAPYVIPSEPSFSGALTATVNSSAALQAALDGQAAGTSLVITLANGNYTDAVTKDWTSGSRTRRVKLLAGTKVMTAYDPMTGAKAGFTTTTARFTQTLTLRGYDVAMVEGVYVNHHRTGIEVRENNTAWLKHVFAQATANTTAGEKTQLLGLLNSREVFQECHCLAIHYGNTEATSPTDPDMDYGIRSHDAGDSYIAGTRIEGRYHQPVSYKEDKDHTTFARFDYSEIFGRSTLAAIPDENQGLVLGQTQDSTTRDVTVLDVEVKRSRFRMGANQMAIDVWNVRNVLIEDTTFDGYDFALNIKRDGAVTGGDPAGVFGPNHPTLTHVRNCSFTETGAIYLESRGIGSSEELRLEANTGPALLNITKVGADQTITRVGGNASGFNP